MVELYSHPIWMKKMRYKKDQAESKARQSKAQQRQFAPAGWRLQKVDAERNPDRPNKPREKDKAHGSPPDHGRIGVIQPHPDVTFSELLKAGQRRHLRNGKVSFVYCQRFPACKRTANKQNAAGSKTHRFAETHVLFSIAD